MAIYAAEMSWTEVTVQHYEALYSYAGPSARAEPLMVAHKHFQLWV